MVLPAPESDFIKGKESGMDIICAKSRYAFFITFAAPQITAREISSDTSKRCNILWLRTPLDRVFLTMAKRKDLPYADLIDYESVEFQPRLLCIRQPRVIINQISPQAAENGRDRNSVEAPEGSLAFDGSWKSSVLHARHHRTSRTDPLCSYLRYLRVSDCLSLWEDQLQDIDLVCKYLNQQLNLIYQLQV